MRKLTLLTLAALLAGFMLPGCVFTDFPSDPLVDAEIECADGCNTYDLGPGVQSAVMGVTGPDSFFFPKEPGEYWANIINLEAAETEQCELWALGGGAPLRIDTYRNEAAHEYRDGCPPSFICLWLGGVPGGSGYDFSACEPDLSLNPDNFCNVGNGTCSGNHFGGATVPVAADSYQSEIAYIAVDETPGGSNEFFNNVRRQPGTLCDDCSNFGAAAQPVDVPPGKMLVCHVPPGNPDNAHEIVIGVAAWPAHEAHGDSEGSCGGGGTAGGEFIPNVDLQPSASTALAGLVPFAFFNLAGTLPFTDDYFGALGMDENSVATFMDILAKYPAEDNGWSNLPISKLHGPAGTTVFTPAVNLTIKADPLRGEYAIAYDHLQSGAADLLEAVLRNTPHAKPLDWNTLSIEFDDGTVLYGSTIDKVFPFAMSLNHTRLSQALPLIRGEEETLGSQGDLDLTSRTRTYSR